MAKQKIDLKPVLVTTEHRGVFFGYVAGETPDLPTKLALLNARNCVYWSTDERGVFGLAVSGPGPKCKIGPQVPTITIWKITSIADCTPAAAAAWEKAPWA
jgi:hypothetical protein